MAIDSREKRASAHSLLLWSTPPGVDPSSVDAAERQAAAMVYSGIAASGATTSASRTMSNLVAAELGKALNRPFHLFEVVFDDATVRNTDAYRDIVNPATGNSHTANGHFIGFDDLSETSGLELARVRIALSGVDQAWISDILTRKYVGRQITIWRGFLDDDSQVIADPYILFQGTMDEPGVVDNPDDGTSVVTVVATNDFAKWDEPNGRRTNDIEQQLHFPGDKAFEFVSQINRQLRWGRRVIDARPRGRAAPLRSGRPRNPVPGSTHTIIGKGGLREEVTFSDPSRGFGGGRGRAEGVGGGSGGGIGHSGGDATGGTRA